MNARAWWRRLRPLLMAVFLAAAAWLLWRQARTIDWPAVGDALAAYPRARLFVAALAALLAHACYCGLDLLSRRIVGHGLPWLRTLAIAFVSYAMNLNIGGTVGGIGFRYRLYARSGVDVASISRIVAFAIAGNWSGFLLLAGTLFLFAPLQLPPQWHLAQDAQRLLGGGMLALLGGALAMAAWSPRRRWTWRGHGIELPAFGVASAQTAIAAASWLAIANLLHLLLPAGIGYLDALGVLLCSVLANLVIRVPGNLGVLEAVFLGLLGARAGAAQVLAALLAYRAMFYLAPLLLALAVYAWLEAQQRRIRGAR
jgi:uncharacterized membrane protein YbhN (UPF0104 family)